MTIFFASFKPSACRMLAALAIAATLSPPALAGPGAHGPNGEHLDGQAVNAAGPAQPRLEAKSEQFELVATLSNGELSILIDRFESNEPVLDAKLEVESGGLKAQARFHADHGDYAVDDAALLKLLATPGEHALVFTLVAGQDSDLLDGTLKVAGSATASGHDHDDHDHDSAWSGKAKWLGAGLLVLAVLAALALQRRGDTVSRKLDGGQA